MIWEPMLELSILFPAAFICFLAAAERLRITKRAVAAVAIPALLLVCAGGGGLCWRMGWPTNYLFLPILVPALAAYCCLTDLPVWKSSGIFLGVCGAFSCLRGLPVVADELLFPGRDSLWMSPVGSLIDFTLCWVLVALCWHPATHAARELLNAGGVVRSWYVFWILPVVFVAVNLYLEARQDALLHSRQLMGMYVMLSLVMIGLLLLFYLLFYLVARELDANARLRQENQFLHMQSSQYEALRAAIAETRRARHDLRHHFNALSALAERGAWEELRRYLSEAGGNVPDAELELCENPAVNGVAGHYAALSRRAGVPFTCELDLPQVLPASEMDVCVVLSNLLENALEASASLGARGYIRLRASLRGEKLLLLTVENAYAGEITERDGVLQSAKRQGEGVGLQSVAHIAEKSGGYCRFLHGGGVFTANVMLRGG